MNEIEILKDQIESLQAALVAKEETHKIKIGEIKMPMIVSSLSSNNPQI